MKTQQEQLSNQSVISDRNSILTQTDTYYLPNLVHFNFQG